MAAHRSGSPLPPEHVHRLLLRAIQQEFRWVQDANQQSGIFLENGCRYYLDAGPHNEWASPEVTTPEHIALYDKVSERTLLLARERAMQAEPGLTIELTKNNVGPAHPDEASWGQHESYTCWVTLPEAALALTAFLASRLPYAGAGCLSSYSRGIGFELSQRARHIKRAYGTTTTSDRALFCARVRMHKDVSSTGWTRAHLIAKDSQRLRGTYLTFAVTGLLFLLINDGHPIGKQLQLASPAHAVRAISQDPWLKTAVPLTDGRSMTALEIQRTYLEQAAPLVAKGDYPEWATQAIKEWSETLETLERNPLELAPRLDAYLKLSLLSHQLERESLSWRQFVHAQRHLARLRQQYHSPVIEAVLKESDGHLPAGLRPEFAAAMIAASSQRGGLDQLRFVVRMQAMELSYHELGGLCDRLLEAGLLDPGLPADDKVTEAMREPPPGGRAEARSRYIRQYSGQSGWRCYWNWLFHSTMSQHIVLPDPFSSKIEEHGDALPGQEAVASRLTTLSRILGG